MHTPLVADSPAQQEQGFQVVRVITFQAGVVNSCISDTDEMKPVHLESSQPS